MRLRSSCLVLAALVAGACGGGSATGPADGPSGGGDGGGPDDASTDPVERRPGSNRPTQADRISMNGFDATDLHAILAAQTDAVHALATAPLASGFVSNARMVLAAGPAHTLAAGPQGRLLLGYLARCAFNSGDELAVYDAGADVTHVFHGGMALARDWEYRALTLTEQRWISACLLAHVNYAGNTVAVLLRGSHPALGGPTGDAADWMSVIEAGYYGDLFLTGRYGDPGRLYACSARFYLGLRALTPDWDLRWCSRNQSGGYTTCGFEYQGQCMPDEPYTITQWLQGGRGRLSCEALDPGGFYQPCCESGPYQSSNEKCTTETNPITNHTAQVYDEVITVYLRDLQAPELANTIAPPITTEPGNHASP